MNTENNSSVNHKYNTTQALPILLSKYEALQTETQCMLISDQKHGQVGIENKKLNFHWTSGKKQLKTAIVIIYCDYDSVLYSYFVICKGKWLYN